MHATTRDGRELYYERHGEGTPVVVFEAGMGLSRNSWGAVVPPVAERTTAVAYDRSGLGRSAPDPGLRDLARQSGDLVDLLDHLGAGPFVLVGHSWGGPIVRRAAARVPERIAGLVLVDQTDEGCDLFFTRARSVQAWVGAKTLPAMARLGLLRHADLTTRRGRRRRTSFREPAPVARAARRLVSASRRPGDSDASDAGNPSDVSCSPEARAMTDHTGSDRHEDGDERADRELIELLNELRVALPGVQVLFAFLLTIPFSQRFTTLDAGDRRMYFAAVLATAGATVCLIAPTAHHRLRFRAPVKEHLLRVANVLTIIGLVLLAFAVSAVTFVVTDVIYPGSAPRTVAAALAGAFVLVWFVLPFLYRSAPTPARDRAERTQARTDDAAVGTAGRS